MARLSTAWLLAALVATMGCSAPEPEPAVNHEQRREQFRDRLRGTLGADYDAPLAEAGDDDARHGSKLYDVLCRACHGPTGTGTGRSARLLAIRPPDLTDPVTASFFSERAKLEIVANGIEGTPMIGWKDMLSEEERLAVLHYMNTLVREPETP